MARRRLPLIRSVFVLFFVMMIAQLVSAGQQEATIIGQVTDESGAVLPGVTVNVAGPALQVGQVAEVTNDRGEYRITALPPGTYTVEYTLSGFQTIRHEGIRLTDGFTAKLDVQLKVGAVAETVTVSGASPVVDTSATATRTTLTRETLELTPTGRNGIFALVDQAPGVRSNAVDVGGSTTNTTITFRAYGQQAESWQTLEGIMTASPKDTQSGNYYDYASIEEARIEAIGKTAEVPVRGVQIGVIVKSGGNEFRGNGYFSGTGGGLQSNSKAEHVAVSELIQKRTDVSGELGGRIIMNKLWFYVSGRDRQEYGNLPLAAPKPGGSPAEHIQHQSFETQKISYQLSQSNKLIGFYNWQAKHEVRGVTRFVPWESRTDQPFRANTGKAEWQAVHGNSLVTALQYGYWRWHADYLSTDAKPAWTDVVTLYQGGNNTNAGNVPGEWLGRLSGTYILPGDPVGGIVPRTDGDRCASDYWDRDCGVWRWCCRVSR